MRVLFLVAWVLVGGCDDGRRAASRDAGSRDAGAFDGSLDSSHVDAGGVDGGGVDGGGVDAGADGGFDAGRDGGTAVDAGRTTLDPELDVPPADNEVCTTPGASCGGARVCRFYDASEGRCESCTECGNLFADCTTGDDCDILFVCFRGSCTNICPLGTFACGAEEDCIDVGHPTHGACRPGF